MTEIKVLIITFCSSVAAFLDPIAGNVFAMLYFLMVNFVVGTLCSILVEGEPFRWQKAGYCALEAFVFFGLVVSFYTVGRYNGNHEGTITAVSTIIYAGGWFYSIRILRNLKKMLKENTPLFHLINFIYTFMSLEFARNIPGLSEYINKHTDAI